MRRQFVRVTEVDSRRLQALVGGAMLPDTRDTGRVSPAQEGLVNADAIVTRRPSSGLRRVALFVEKPDWQASRALAAAGALVNAFIFVARGRTLVRLYEDALPELVRAFVPVVLAGSRETSLRELYDQVPIGDFSRGVLERSVNALRVLAVPECGWSDLGTPVRLGRFLGQRRPDQAAARTAALV